MEDVRIVSTAFSAAETIQPSAQPAAAESSFRAALDNASTVGNAEPHSENGDAKASPKVKVKGHESSETAPADSAAPESGGEDSVEGAGDDRWATANTGVTPTAGESTVDGTLPAGTDVSAVVQPSGSESFRQGIVFPPLTDGGFRNADIKGAEIPAAGGEGVQPPSKGEQPKVQASLKAASTQATADISIVGQSVVPIVTMVSWRVSQHGEINDASRVPVNGLAPARSADTPAKATTLVHSNAEPSATMSFNDVAGLELGAVLPVSAEMPQAGVDMPALPGLSGNFQLSGNGPVGLTQGKSMQTAVTPVNTPTSTEASDAARSAPSIEGGTGDASSHIEVSAIQTAEGAQIDALKNAAGSVLAKGTGDGASQAPALLVSHEVATPPHTTSVTSDSMQAAKADHLPAAAHSLSGDAVAGSGVNSAKLIQTMGETEMHVGMHSEEFGDISIRTSVAQQQMVTQISLAHNDLSQAISAHLSTVQTKLGEEYGLHASIEISNQGTPLSGGQGDSSRSNQQSYGSSSGGESTAPPELMDCSPGVVALASGGSGHGLDIRV